MKVHKDFKIKSPTALIFKFSVKSFNYYNLQFTALAYDATVKAADISFSL